MYAKLYLPLTVIWQENLQDHRQTLIEGNAHMAMQIEKADCEREEVRPQVEELERYECWASIWASTQSACYARESLELESTLKRLNAEQAELQKDSRVLKVRPNHSRLFCTI